VAHTAIMKVLVNAASIREGGPLVVLKNLMGEMGRAHPDGRWLVAGPELLAPALGEENIEYVHLQAGSESARVIPWYEIGLPREVRRWQPDVLFSVTNYLPFRAISVPTVLLVQHAGHFSKDFMRLDRAFANSLGQQISWRYKNTWVRRSVRVAGDVIVQTGALADRIAEAGLRPRDKIAVVHHGPGQMPFAASPRPVREGAVRIGYVTKFGVQKNFETLFRAVRLLAADGRDIRLVLTLDPAYGAAAQVLRMAEELGIGGRIENHGEVRGSDVTALYDSFDIMAFCSVAESFGFPMVEAMARGVPIVVADTPENREVTGEASFAFSPFDPGDLARQLSRLIGDPLLRGVQAERSLERGREFSWAKAAAGTFAVIERAAKTS
jgi:glycosyltransferase involved in cell wall biosynthesis